MAEQANTYEDRRAHQRYDVVQAIFLEVMPRTGPRPGEDYPVLRCETVDISVGGLRLLVPEEVPAQSRINIAVPMTDWKDNLELTGSAVWCRPAESKPGFWVGLQLDDSSREDMARWCQVAHSLGG